MLHIRYNYLRFSHFSFFFYFLCLQNSPLVKVLALFVSDRPVFYRNFQIVEIFFCSFTVSTTLICTFQVFIENYFLILKKNASGRQAIKCWIFKWFFIPFFMRSNRANYTRFLGLLVSRVIDLLMNVHLIYTPLA